MMLVREKNMRGKIVTKQTKKNEYFCIQYEICSFKTVVETCV